MMYVHSTVASHPVNPVTWAGVLLLQGGDIEVNPGRTQKIIFICAICKSEITNRQRSLRCNPNTPHIDKHWLHQKCTEITAKQYTESWTCRLHKNNNTHHKNKTLNILQININGIHKQQQELEHIATQHNIDIITIQETKLTPKQKTPPLHNYTAIR